MLRRLMLLALALCAFAALESCGVSRLAGPSAVDNNKQGSTGQTQDPTAGGGSGGQGGQDDQPVANGRGH